MHEKGRRASSRFSEQGDGHAHTISGDHIHKKRIEGGSGKGPVIRRRPLGAPEPKPVRPAALAPKVEITAQPCRYKLTLEYDGTRFSGWQKQSDAKTIQGALLAAGAEIFQDPNLDIQGCGRTDAGVHALFFTAHLESTHTLPPQQIKQRFNDLLPATIVILEVQPVHERFHARHDCIARSYIYQISRRKSAFAKKQVWWVQEDLNLAAMTEALALLPGMHDFASFADKQERSKSTKVMLNAAHLYDQGDIIRIRIIGSHFLWKMVRRIVGVLVEVGRGNLGKNDVAEFLRRVSDDPARFTAPASGLFFERAFYDERAFDEFLADSL